MNKVITFIFLLFLGMNIFSQDVVIDKDVDEQYQTKKGPNYRYYNQFYIGFGGMADFDEETGAKINAWRSSNFIFGYRYKLKLLSFYALGFDLNFNQNIYFMEGDSENPFDALNPLTFDIDEKKQTLTNNAFALEVYQRINIGKRGNSLGKYLDLGVSGQWNHTVKETVKKEFTDEQNYYGKSLDVRRKLDYIEAFQYDLTARIGVNQFVVYGKYRMSDYFNDKFIMPELPRLSLGIQYAFK
jgi:hypothetical protein